MTMNFSHEIDLFYCTFPFIIRLKSKDACVYLPCSLVFMMLLSSIKRNKNCPNATHTNNNNNKKINQEENDKTENLTQRKTLTDFSCQIAKLFCKFSKQFHGYFLCF